MDHDLDLSTTLKEDSPYGEFARAVRDWRRGAILTMQHLAGGAALTTDGLRRYIRQSDRSKRGFDRLMAAYAQGLDVHRLGVISRQGADRWPLPGEAEDIAGEAGDIAGEAGCAST